MTDNEKNELIAALEHCTENRCRGCPYYEKCETHGFMKIAEDVLDVIRPRVLTLEEANEADIVWLEVMGSDRIRPVRLYQRERTVVIRKLIATPEEVTTDGYGRVWRCWSARPTKKQREAVRWDD